MCVCVCVRKEVSVNTRIGEEVLLIMIAFYLHLFLDTPGLGCIFIITLYNIIMQFDILITVIVQWEVIEGNKKPEKKTIK